MTISENERLDLRRAFEECFNNPRIAEIAMDAMPPIDYASLATKRDVDAVGAELRGEMAALRGGVDRDIAELKVEVGGLARSIGQLEGKFGLLEGKFGLLEGRFGQLEGSLDKRLAQNLQVMVLTMLTAVGMLVTYALSVLG